MSKRSGYTRRRLLAGLGAVVAGGVAGRFVQEHALIRTPERDGRDVAAASATPHADLGADRPAPAVVTERDVATTYPLVAYNDRTGEYDVVMPVNVRFDLTGSAYGLSDVREAVRIGDGWTGVVAAVGEYWPTADAKPPDVWQRETRRLAPPVGNYRKLIDPLGPRLGYHLYLWPVRRDGELVGVAAQAHADVGTVTDHVGGRFDEAAEAVSSTYAAAGWRVDVTDFDYGVSPGYHDFWGPTGDRVIRPPQDARRS